MASAREITLPAQVRLGNIRTDAWIAMAAKAPHHVVPFTGGAPDRKRLQNPVLVLCSALMVQLSML